MIEGDDLKLFRRSIRHAAESASGPDLDTALADLGWPDALEVDPRAAVSTLFELQGAANTHSGSLDRVLLGALGLDAGPVGVVLPGPARSDAPGRLVGGRLQVDGLCGAGAAAGAQVVVVAGTDGGHLALRVPTGQLEIRPAEGIDTWIGLHRVTGDVAAHDPANGPPADWAAAVDRARVALGHELVGASRTMLERAREHALERVQFGRPISAFQAVRHRLAEALVAIETAQAVLDAAWLDRSDTTAAMAKAVAGRGARVTSRHCQQVLAGIGFTTEHDLHRYVRRVLVLDQLFGSADTITRAQGADILGTRRLPPLLPL